MGAGMTPLDKYKEAAREVVNAAEAECHANKYMFGFPTVHGKETLDKHIAQAIAATEARVRRECAEIVREWTPIAQDHCDIRIAQRLQDVASAILTSGDTTDAE